MPETTPPSGPAPLDPQDEADIVAMVDGRLDPGRQVALESRAGGDQVLSAAIARQHAGRGAITAAVTQTSAPHALRMRIDQAATAPAGRRRRRWWPVAGIAAAATAVVAALVVSSGSELSVRETVTAALRPPVAAATVDIGQPGLLHERVDEVRFPDYAAKFGWKAVGTRTDEIDGRKTRTVFYERGERRIAYTIVEGDALPEPSDARSVSSDGVDLRVFTSGDRTAVTWRRLGHTCVLSSEDVPAAELVKLASWKAKGAVAF